MRHGRIDNSARSPAASVRFHTIITADLSI
jgi:hypothetical protein